MKIIDCLWEQKNIGKRTIEIIIEEADSYDANLIKQVVRDYEYIVVKVPMNRPQFNMGLSELGFGCIETQMNVGINLSEFNISRIQHLYDETRFEIVRGQEDFLSVVSRIQPGMFSTDRISIDSMFGESIGCLRYINWMTAEYNEGTAQLIKIIYKNEHVGFMLIKQEKEIIYLLLNGLYKQYHGKGIGILTPASPMMYAKRMLLPIEKEETSISSNNVPVVKLYNKLGFRLLQQSYVFIKHQGR